MRIISPISCEKQWFLNIFFQENGQRHPVRIGKDKTLLYGRGKGHVGRLAHVQIECSNKDRGSVEIFPGATILGIVMSPSAHIDEQYVQTLNPAVDAVELVKPSGVLNVDDLGLIKDLIGPSDNDKVRRELQILEGSRKRFLA